jgi:uncharacterized iron-regulated membrane protein
MKLRPLIFWPHLTAGLLAGLVILIMCVTGALLTYERQLIAWSDSHYRSVPPAQVAARLPVEALIGRLRVDRPDLAPTAITIRSEADAPVAFAVPQRVVYADAYTGAVLGEGSQTVRRIMSEIRAWHRWLAIDGEGRPMARLITGWSNVVFLFIVVSGMYLWLPRKLTWSQVKAVAIFNPRARGKARDFNWHNVFGIWSAIPLFIVVISAVPISFQWGNALVYRAVGEEPPRPQGRAAGPAGPAGEEGGPTAGRAAGPGRQGGPPRAQAARAGGANTRGEGARREGRPPVSIAGLNDLWARADRHVPEWRTINMRIPTAADAPVVFAIDRGDGGQPQHRSTLTLDRGTGAVVSFEAFSDLTFGRRVRNVMRFAHTGEVLGIPGQTVAGIATFGGAVLACTGILLALRRFRAWIRRRRTPAELPTAAVRTPAA